MGAGADDGAAPCAAKEVLDRGLEGVVDLVPGGFMAMLKGVDDVFEGVLAVLEGLDATEDLEVSISNLGYTLRLKHITCV